MQMFGSQTSVCKLNSSPVRNWEKSFAVGVFGNHLASRLPKASDLTWRSYGSLKRIEEDPGADLGGRRRSGERLKIRRYLVGSVSTTTFSCHRALAILQFYSDLLALPSLRSGAGPATR